MTSSPSSQEGQTALILASMFGHREIAQLLVDRGADVNTQEKVGNCAFPKKQYFLIRKLCVRIRFLRDSRIMTTSSLS